jgi:hypothetical protein
MVSAFSSIFNIFFFSKSIFIFQKWTKINVQKRLSKNNVGFSKNVEFYIINCQSGLKRMRPSVKRMQPSVKRRYPWLKATEKRIKTWSRNKIIFIYYNE